MPAPSATTLAQTDPDADPVTGSTPDQQTRAAARGEFDAGDMFDDHVDQIEAAPVKPAPKPVSQVQLQNEPKPKPTLKPANPPAASKPVTPDTSEQVTRAPRTLFSIPPETDDEEEIVNVEPEKTETAVETETKTETEVEAEVKPAADKSITDLAAALKLAFPQMAKEETKTEEMTPEARNKALNVYTVPDDLYDRMANPETRKAAMNELVEGIRVESRTWANAVSEHTIKAFMEGFVQQQQQKAESTQSAEQHRATFFKQYPVLKEEKFGGLIKACNLLLKQEGFVPTSAAHMYKTLAERVEKEAKGLNPDFSLGVPTTTKSATVPKPTVAKGKGGGGDAGLKTATTAKYQKAPGTEVFD